VHGWFLYFGQSFASGGQGMIPCTPWGECSQPSFLVLITFADGLAPVNIGRGEGLYVCFCFTSNLEYGHTPLAFSL